MNPLKELLETSPKVIAKFIFEVGQQLNKLLDEYDKLQKEKTNAPEYEILKNKTPKSNEAQHWKSKYELLWNKHQELLRSIQKK